MDRTAAPAPIDPRGPRTNQAVLAVALLLGLVTGQEWVVPLFAVVLFLGAAFGPSYGPVLRLYRDVIRPRLAPPSELEDPRPPRFSAWVGTVVLGAATVAFLAGATTVGWALAMLVAVLAGLAAVTGLCIGCEMYVGLVRLRGGVRITTVDRTGHDDRPARGGAGSGRTDGLAPLPVEQRAGAPQWVVFSTEFCAVCPQLVAELGERRPGEAVTVLDVAEHLDLASAYKVRRAPTVLRVGADGAVLERLAGVDAARARLGELDAAPARV